MGEELRSADVTEKMVQADDYLLSLDVYKDKEGLLATDMFMQGLDKTTPGTNLSSPSISPSRASSSDPTPPQSKYGNSFSQSRRLSILRSLLLLAADAPNPPCKAM